MALELATVAQLRIRLQNEGLDADVAQRAIDEAGWLIRAVSGQELDFGQSTVELVGGARDLVLQQVPVFVDGTHPLVVEESVDAGQSWHVSAASSFRRVGNVLRRRAASMWQPCWGAWPPGSQVPVGVWAPDVRVTYWHGYVVAPPVLTMVCLDAASTLASNPEGLRTEQVGGISLTWATESLQAPAALVDTIGRKLKRLGFGPPGAFSIGAS